MLNIYIIRHGKAMSIGKNYDNLSRIGYEQAALLGKNFKKNKLIPDYIITGSLKRQKETALCIETEIKKINNKKSFKWIETDSLNEIKIESWLLIQNYLQKKDTEFAMLCKKKDLLKNSNNKESGTLFKKIGQRVLKEWVELKNNHNNSELKNVENFSKFYTHTLETFTTLQSLEKKHSEEMINIFMISSGTPISLLVGHVLGLDAEHSLPLSSWIYNTSVSKLYLNNDNLQLVSFNNLSHLDESNLLTLI